MEQIKALLNEAEVYRRQGLLEESLECYRRTLGLLEGHEVFSKNLDFMEAVRENIRLVEDEISELELDIEAPELPQEIQDLISKLFSYSKNQDIAAIEGAVALAEFGQYEKSLSEFRRLLKEGKRASADREMLDLSAQFNTIIRHLMDSYKFIQEQSIQLSRYASELSKLYKKIRQEQDLRNSLSRYVGQNVVERILKSDDRVLFGSERREVTVLFADIRSFTTMSEKMAVEEIVEMLNQYFSAMVDIVFKRNGILDKFVGDELMAVFGHLASKDSTPCHDAVKTALEMQADAEKLNNMRLQQGKQTFEIGIGINTGMAVIGNVGSKNRMDYTVIGDCVNVAARLQQVAKGGEIIIGEQTYQYLQGDFVTKKKGKLKLKNKAKPLLCYQVLR